MLHVHKVSDHELSVIDDAGKREWTLADDPDVHIGAVEVSKVISVSVAVGLIVVVCAAGSHPWVAAFFAGLTIALLVHVQRLQAARKANRIIITDLMAARMLVQSHANDDPDSVMDWARHA